MPPSLGDLTEGAVCSCCHCSRDRCTWQQSRWLSLGDLGAQEKGDFSCSQKRGGVCLRAEETQQKVPQ